MRKVSNWMCRTFFSVFISCIFCTPSHAQRTEYAKLTANDSLADDFFGYSVAISGSTMVVGAYRDDCAGGTNCGSAYVFEFDGSLWVQRAKLTSSDLAAGDVLGQCVAIDGDTIVLGAPAKDCIAGASCGAAYVFVRPGGGWADMTQTAKLTASDANALDTFAFSVSISGETIAVGAPFQEDGAPADGGAAYIFVKPGGGWSNLTQTAKLTPAVREDTANFGNSIAIRADTVVVGSYLEDAGPANQGAAYVFVRPGGGWSNMTQTGMLTASDPTAENHFGTSVAVGNDLVAVGTPLRGCPAGGDCGAVYVFVKPGASWSNMTQTARLTALDAEGTDQLGYSVAIDEHMIIAGAPNDDCAGGTQCGSAYIFRRPPGGWINSTQVDKVRASDPADSDFFGITVSLGGGTLISGSFRDDCLDGADCGAAYVFHAKNLIYVKADAGGSNDGTSWTNAFRYLQDALAAAQPGREIRVAKGRYKPDRGAGITPGNRTATFQLLNGVGIFGGFVGTETLLSQRDWNANPTILSGDLSGDDTSVPCTQDLPDCAGFGDLCIDGACLLLPNTEENSHHVVTGSGTDAGAVMDGFIITAGQGLGAGGGLADYGAGLRNDPGSPTISNCLFRENSAPAGASIYNQGSSPTVTNCVFVRNFAGGSGGAILNSQSSNPTVSNCTFRGNHGSAMANAFSNPDVINCRFIENPYPNVGDGGGIRNFNSSPRVVNSIFHGNSADRGGAIFNEAGSSTMIVNCSFSGNNASLGGAIYNDDSAPTIVNSTFSRNDAAQFGGGLYATGFPAPSITNSIFWQNVDSNGMIGGAQIRNADAGFPTHYNIVQGGYTGSGSTNNINADPLFVDPDGADNILGTLDDDFRLRAGSPGIDSGDSTAVPADTFDLNNNGLTSTEGLPFDLAGFARFVDDAATPDTGVPRVGYAMVDRGVYEYFTDCNGNNIVDANDIASFVSEDCDSSGWPGNGIPDECDIAACNADPGCDDCNLNGIPDGCDIGSSFSRDTSPADGIPDECAVFTDDCLNPGAEQYWTCPDNWNLGGDYPDDADSAAGVFVSLASGAVAFLDQTVVIPALRVEGGATVLVTQGGAQGDLQFATPALLDVSGTMLMGGSRVVGQGVNPQVTIGPDGIYEATVAAVAGVTSASLLAGQLDIVGTDCFVPPCPHGGEMALTESMEVTVSGNLTIDGTLANGECVLNRGVGSVAMSFHTPPSIRVLDDSAISVGAVLSMVGAAGVILESSAPITVSGDWSNQSVRPDCFDAAAGVVRLNGVDPQTFEVAATDSGGAGATSDDFRIGTLEIAANADVTMVDDFDNDLSSQASCGEAQYVGTLVLEEGSSLTASNCRLYYDTLIKHPSATLALSSCGEIRASVDPDSVASDPSGLIKSRTLSFVAPSPAVAGSGIPSAIRVQLQSLHHVNPPYTGGAATDFSAFEGQVRWVGPPLQYVESSSNPSPFKAANLQCTPHYHDWSTEGLVHVFGSAIVPSSSYRVQTVASSCAGIEDRCTAVSVPLVVATTRWGDVETPYNPPAPSTQPDLGDVSALVNKFRSAPGAPIKARALLVGGDAFGTIDIGTEFSFIHIAACVDAFRGRPYPHTIEACP